MNTSSMLGARDIGVLSPDPFPRAQAGAPVSPCHRLLGSPGPPLGSACVPPVPRHESALAPQLPSPGSALSSPSSSDCTHTVETAPSLNPLGSLCWYAPSAPAWTRLALLVCALCSCLDSAPGTCLAPSPFWREHLGSPLFSHSLSLALQGTDPSQLLRKPGQERHSQQTIP